MLEFPSHAAAILDAVYHAYPGLSAGDGDQQRFFMRLVVEQIIFDLRDYRFGLKSADRDRPQGPSEIAFRETGEMTFGGWRVIDGDGHVTGTIGAPYPNPPWQNFPDQWFIACEPVDHLSDQPAPPANPPPLPPTPPSEPSLLATTIARVDALERLLTPMATQWDDLHGDVEHLNGRIDQRYISDKWGIRIVSVPESQALKP